MTRPRRRKVSPLDLNTALEMAALLPEGAAVVVYAGPLMLFVNRLADGTLEFSTSLHVAGDDWELHSGPEARGLHSVQILQEGQVVAEL